MKLGGETVVKNITVIPKDFGTVEIEAEPEASEAANTEFRNAVWPLYGQPAREKLWSGGFACPAENYMTLVDFGQTKVTGGKQGLDGELGADEGGGEQEAADRVGDGGDLGEGEAAAALGFSGLPANVSGSRIYGGSGRGRD